MTELTVFHDGQGMVIFKEIGDQFNLKDGQSINSGDMFRKILVQNCCLGIAKCEITKIMKLHP